MRAASSVPAGVVLEQRPRDRPVGNRGTCEGACDLRDAACRAVCEPFAGGHRLVVERARGLEVQDDDRRVDRLHHGEHLGRGRIRRRVDEEELRSAGGERVAGGAGRLGSVDEARRDDLRAHRLEPLLQMPYYLSPGWLRIDPAFTELKGNPRFEKLLAGG